MADAGVNSLGLSSACAAASPSPSSAFWGTSGATLGGVADLASNSKALDSRGGGLIGGRAASFFSGTALGASGAGCKRACGGGKGRN